MTNRPIIDLFAGAGGLSLGAHLAGFETTLRIDADADLISSAALNFPHAKSLVADLSILDARELLRLTGKRRGQVAGIIGGPPCQGFSRIGKRQHSDPRNQLVSKFFEAVDAVRPSFFLMENVPGLTDDPFRSVLERGINLVAQRYTIIGPFLLTAADFGVATSRTRLILIGFRPDHVDPLTEAEIITGRAKRRPTVYQAIHDIPGPTMGTQDAEGICWAEYKSDPESGQLGQVARTARRAPPRGLAASIVRSAHAMRRISGLQPTAHTAPVERRFRQTRPGHVDAVSRIPRLAWDGLCPTLRAGTGKERGSHQSIRPLHPEEHRVITVREAARLQGFPDWFQFHRTKWHSFRMIGNSVPPPMAAAVLKALRDKIDQA